MTLKAYITDCEGTELTDDERALFRDYPPYGFILFARNCESPDQLKRLTDSYREVSGREDVPILIDQEGGRVMRLTPPKWRACPAAGELAALVMQDITTATEAIYLNARLMASELLANGINVDCAPVADLRIPGAHDIIGDRAYGESVEQTVALAREMANGLMDGGVMPIMKHIPGHGRAMADSHIELPRVTASLDELEQADFAVFKELYDLPMAMTAHVVYTALDAENMATTSGAAINYIRDTIGFDGVLMSDDISMKAMEGDFPQRCHNVIAAGCDLVLHCNGSLQERREVAEATPELSADATRRSTHAFEMLRGKVLAAQELADAGVRLEQLLTKAA